MLRIVVVVFFALFASQSVAAQVWELEQGNEGCGIGMTYEGDGEPEVFLASFDDGSNSLVISNGNWTARQGDEYEVALVLDDRVFTGNAIGTMLSNRRGVRVGVGADFVEAFAAANRFAVLRGETVLALLSLRGSADGVARLRQCVRRVMAVTARERAAAEALARRREVIPADPFYDPSRPLPVGSEVSWITTDDYPSEAIRLGLEGFVAVRLAIGPDGSVVGCEVTEPSPHQILNDATCRHITRRARFQPLSDSSDVTLPRTFDKTVRWQLP